MADERIATTDIVPAIALAAELGCDVATAVRAVMAAAGADQGVMDEARAMMLQAGVAPGPAGGGRRDSAATELERQRIASREASRKRKADAEDRRIKLAEKRLQAKAANEVQRIAIAEKRLLAKTAPKPPKLTPEEKAAAKISLQRAAAEDEAVYNWACKLARQRESLRATLGREPTLGELRGRFLRWYANFKPHLSEAEAMQESIQSFGLPGASGRGLAIEQELATMAGPPPLAPAPCAPATPVREVEEIDPPRTDIADEPA